MKVRFETKCVKCHRMMQVGTQASRAYGGIWHTACLIDYDARRAESTGRSLAASGRRNLRG